MSFNTKGFGRMFVASTNKEVNESTVLPKGLDGRGKAAYKLGFSSGKDSKPKISKDKLLASFGSTEGVSVYLKGYEDGKEAADNEYWHDQQKSRGK